MISDLTGFHCQTLKIHKFHQFFFLPLHLTRVEVFHAKLILSELCMHLMNVDPNTAAAAAD